MSTSSVYSPPAPAASLAPSRQALIELDSVALRFRIFTDRSPLLKQFVLNKVLRRHKMMIQNYEDFWLYRNLTMRIEHGDRVGIIGSNGAGKSTLLKVMSGIYHPTSGSIRVRGRIAPLIELGGGFNPELSGRENIFLNGALLGFSHKEMAHKVEAILDFANLREFAQMPVKYYSSGMVLRLGFSIATDIVPEILLLDEIFSAGDAEFRQKAQARMHELLTASHIVVLVSHELGLVKEVCNRVIWIDHGCVVMDGEPDDVCDAYLQKRYPPGFHVTQTADMWQKNPLAHLGVAERPKPVSPELLERLPAVEYYQPLYGVIDPGKPVRPCRDRAEAIERALAPLGRNIKLIEFGSSLGFFPFYFADRGIQTHGWDFRPQNVAVAEAVQRLNGLPVAFETKALTIDSAREIPPGAFDVALIMSVLHHVVHERGLEYVQELLATVLERIPTLVLEIALRHEEVKFPWRDSQPEDPLALLARCPNAKVRKIGEFKTHLSPVLRPTYLVQRG